MSIRPTVDGASGHRVRILKWMQKLDCTTKELAGAAGVDRTSLSCYLNRVDRYSNPSVGWISKIYSGLEAVRSRRRRSQ